MIALIEMVLGSKVGRWVAEFVLAALVIGVGVLYLEHRGASHEFAKLQKSSTALVAKVTRQNADAAARYRASVAQNQEKLHADEARAIALRTQLDDSVRNFAAYRRAHPDVARAPGQPSAAAGGEPGAVDFGAIAVRLGEVGNELAGSVADLRGALQSCERDRDSLTGEPR